jgi:hypothetical protein
VKIKRKNRPHPTIAHMGIDRGWNIVRETARGETVESN